MAININKHIILICAICGQLPVLHAGDWPQYKYNASRIAHTDSELPTTLSMQWTLHLPKPAKAWRDQSNIKRMPFDSNYEPVVAGKMLFVGSMNDDTVRAYHTETGEEIWRFYTEGPVRLAPAFHKGKLYVTSDDGFLYSLDAKTGKKLGKFRGGPTGNRLIGNQRMVSMWPARTGVCIYDDTAYFGAGFWPFMGCFVHALDIDTGKVLYTNSGEGMQWQTQPHKTGSFSGVTPQGYLSANDEFLYVASGRNSPGIFDRKTGHLKRYWGRGGFCGYVYPLSGMYCLQGTAAYSYKTMDQVKQCALFMDRDFYYTQYRKTQKFITRYKLDTELTSRTVKSRAGKGVEKFEHKSHSNIEIANKKFDIFLRAGDTFVGRSPKAKPAPGDYSLFKIKGDKLEVVTEFHVEGEARSFLTADNKLFVATSDGRIICFSSKGGGKEIKFSPTPLKGEGDTWKTSVEQSLRVADDNTGYALVPGIGSGRMIDELLLQSDMQLIVVDPSASKVDALRKRMSDCGLYGRRISAFVDEPAAIKLPQYFASLIVSEDGLSALTQADLAKLHGYLRPYDGVLIAGRDTLKNMGLPVKSQGDLHFIRRGEVEGSANWTHHYSDAGNTVFSPDKNVKLPMGLLWFGGTTNDEILPRHGHGPAPQVVDGRLYIEGENMLRCLDIYTGRKLWQKELPDLGWYYRHTDHHPGAGEVGSNYVSSKDCIYVIYGDGCLLLDAKTGETRKTLKMPAVDGKHPYWGSIRIVDKYLIATISPVKLNIREKTGAKAGDAAKNKFSAEALRVDQYSTGSEMLCVMDRFSGKVLWTRKAGFNFRHNAIAASDKTVFCIDRMSAEKLSMLSRRGKVPSGKAELLALELESGRVLWKTDTDVFGSFLSYSQEYDLVIQSTSTSADRAKDEAKQGISVYHGGDGKVAWKDLKTKYSGPVMLCHDEILANTRSYVNADGGWDIRTGKPLGWKWMRNYGCNTAIAGENMLLFRSGTAGFYDYKNQSGTGNFGGFKSSCTSNMIPAGGVLTIPDYTRTCGCAYNNQTSLALVHMPELAPEYWTFGGTETDLTAINFGAPGDRKSGDTFWVGRHGGKTPLIMGKEKGWLESPENRTLASRYVKPGTMTDTPSMVIDGGQYYTHHSLYFRGSDTSWIAASGYAGMQTITFNTLVPKDGATVRLHFAEPEASAVTGDRVFDVYLNDKKVLSDFDIVKAAGGTRKLLVKSFVVDLREKLVIRFEAKAGTALISGVELGTRLKMPRYLGGLMRHYDY